MPESSVHHERRLPRESSVRAADRDRDAVADVLREHHLAGRLDSDELQVRVDRCYAAKTYGELDELVADLPREEPARPVRRSWRWPAVAILPLLVALIALSGGHLLWLAIPVFFFIGRPLLRRSAGRRFGSGFMGCGAHRNASTGSRL
jgi:hypothetical protein